MKFPASFKQALLLNFLVVTVLPILFLGVFSFRYFTNQHIVTLTELLNAHAEDVSSEAGEFLHDTSSILFMVAEMISDRRLHGDEKISRHLQLALEQSDSFESIFVLNEDNKVIHMALAESSLSRYKDYLGLDMSAHKIFSADKGKLAGPRWSDTFLSTITVEPSITLAIPLENGTLLGTVSLQRLTEALIERIGKVSHGFNFSLLDQHGVIIADSSPGVTSQRLNMRLHPEIRAAR